MVKIKIWFKSLFALVKSREKWEKPLLFADEHAQIVALHEERFSGKKTTI